jgi:putative membrane protein
MHGGWDGDWSWWWIAMTIMMVALWGGLAWLLVSVFRRSDGPSSPRTHTPGEILDERFARGEIDVDEYQKRRDVLRTTQH